jgi:hypothetical protein
MSNLAVPTLEGVALSPQQDRVWRLQQQTHLNLRTRFSIAIRGPVDFAGLQAAWHQVEERHQILRTSFEYLPGVKDPLQVVQLRASNLRFADAMLNGDGHFNPELFSEMESGNSSVGSNQIFVTLYELNEKRHILAFSLPVLLADGETGSSFRNCAGFIGPVMWSKRKPFSMLNSPSGTANCWPVTILRKAAPGGGNMENRRLRIFPSNVTEILPPILLR